jgi:branched-chain amino acid transport system ATP-binding protein
MLELHDLRAGYGYSTVLHGMSMTVRAGNITSIIGANGAGKTTTLRSIVNLLQPSSGEVRFGGKPLTSFRPEAILRMGVCLVPEGRQIFAGLSVLENLRVGAFQCNSRREVARRLERIFALFPRLQERRTQLGTSLSGGEQQMLAIGRGLMSDPKVLLLDEPSMGLAPKIVDQVFAVVSQLRDQGSTVLLVEQNARRALQLADYAYVLENGRIVKEGTGRELLADPTILATYLGET